MEDPDEGADEVLGVGVGAEIAAGNRASDGGNERGVDERAGAFEESPGPAGDGVHRGDDKRLVCDMFDEEQHPSAETFKRRHRGGKAPLGSSKSFHFGSVDRFDERVPSGKVAIKRAGSDACLTGNFVEARGGAVAGKGLLGSLENALAVALSISAGPSRGKRWRKRHFRYM